MSEDSGRIVSEFLPGFCDHSPCDFDLSPELLKFYFEIA